MEVVIICKVATEIVTVVVAVCGGVPESVTVNWNAVAGRNDGGVPLISPVEGFSVSPVGGVPDQVYGVSPPVAVSVVEHATPAMQSSVTLGAVVNRGVIVSVKVTVAVCCGVPESVNVNG